MTTPGGPGFPGGATGQQWPATGSGDVPGYQSRVGRTSAPVQKSRTRLIAVAAVAVVIVAAVVAALFLFVFRSEEGPSASTLTFLEAVKAQDGPKAAEVSCQQAATLAEQFGRSVATQTSLGEWQSIEVGAPENQDDQRAVVHFDLEFANVSVHGRTTLLLENEAWKVCALELDPPRSNAAQPQGG